jgi:hypothetical protein
MLAGLFAGLSAGTKYTGLINLALIVVALLLRPAGQMSFVQRLRNVILLSAVGLALCSPWYVRNTVQLGVPIYPPPPILSKYLEARAFPPEAVQSFQEYIRDRGKGYGRSLLQFVLLPYNFTYRPGAFHGAGGIGLVPLAFLPIALLALPRNGTSLAWLLWSGLFVIAWFYTQQEARFLIPVLAVAAALGGFGADYLWQRSKLIGRILIAAVAGVSIAYGLGTDLHGNRDRIASLFSRPAEARRESDIPVREAFQYLNATPEVESVLVLNRFVPCYYLRKPYVKIRGQYWEQPLPGVTDASTALRQVQNLHVTHILDVQGLFESNFELDPNTTPFHLVWSSKDARIYKVAASLR